MALAMVLVFALVTVWGSVAHACHGPHHGAAQEIVAHQTEDASDAFTVHEGDVHATKHASQEQAPQNGGHPCCTDLQCHGGTAIVAAGLAAAWPLPEGEKFLIYDQTREGWFLSSLDRPPRATVQI